jgi:isopentenyl-diphosphate delta-isomerase
MKAKVILVDENDTVIGHKLYKDIDFEHEIFRVSHLWVTDKENNILLQKRSGNVAFYAHRWSCAVGGTNDEGETYESNIIKEAKEEIHLEIKNPTFVHKKLETYHGNRKLFCSYFSYQLNEIKPKITFSTEEISDVKWVTSIELKSLVQLHPNSFAPDISDFLLSQN